MHQLTWPHLQVRAGSARIFDDSPIGPLRLFRAQEAAQAAWWLPLALAGAFLGWTAATAGGSKRIVVLSLCGWTAIYWLVFSFVGGVVHFYYLAVLGPPLTQHLWKWRGHRLLRGSDGDAGRVRTEHGAGERALPGGRPWFDDCGAACAS
jgi:hypothetical protein